MPESHECDRAIVIYSIPTFIISSSLSQFNSTDVCIKFMHDTPRNTLRAQQGKRIFLNQKQEQGAKKRSLIFMEAHS